MRRCSVTRKRTGVAAAVLLVIAIMALGACGGAAREVAPVRTEPRSAPAFVPEPMAESMVIRFALAPDPLWQWLIDSGTLAAWEQEHGVRIEASHPFRPFTAIVSGSADIIVVNALEVPLFTSDLEHTPVIIGRYTWDRSITATKRTSLATDLAGVVEGRIAMESQIGSTLLWALIADSRHDLELIYGGPDFEFMIATFGVADAVERGEADACICQPEESVQALGTGSLRALYDGKSAAELYAETLGDASRPPLGQVFLADGAWRQRNPTAVKLFVDLWETAIQHWHRSFPTVIAQYPELLSVQTDDEVQWLSAYVELHNWVVPSVYTEPEDRQLYVDAVSLLMDAGHLPEHAPVPQLGLQRIGAAAGSQQDDLDDASAPQLAALGAVATNGGQ